LIGPAHPTSSDPGLEYIVGLAREDLAGRIGVSADEIELVETQAVTWPDPGLGCPRPGMRFKQVPVEGALIRFRAAGHVYEYHSAGRRLLLCPSPQDAPTASPPTRRDRPRD
jgi:hypothetical protein